MSDNKSTKVFVMMSGGVDSSVSALLLRDAGYDVTGVYMKNWSPSSIQSLTDCPWKQDLADAKKVAKQIGIKFRSVNFEREYRERVVNYFLASYRNGQTPNPDVKCNQEIKFGAFYRWAKAQGADKIASGHYAQIAKVGNQFLIKRGKDKDKDQSYFLWSVERKILKDIIFPIGGLSKNEVRLLAQSAKLAVAKKKDSQGICFIGHINVGEFLRSELGVKAGNLITEKGKVVGKHAGAYLYTIGQRHGFDITKPKTVAKELGYNDSARVPLYVTEKDIDKNTITISDAQDMNLESSRFIIEDAMLYTKTEDKLKVQIRYQGEAVSAKINTQGKDVLIELKRPLRAIADGQFAVIYRNDIVVGGGKMRAVTAVLSKLTTHVY